MRTHPLNGGRLPPTVEHSRFRARGSIVVVSGAHVPASRIVGATRGTANPMTLPYPDAVHALPPGLWGRPAMSTHHIRAWTETSYVAGTLLAMDSDERLSDVLNRRQSFTVVNAHVVPYGAPSTAECVQPQVDLDPYDVEFVLGGPLEERDTRIREARRIHKVRYPVLVIGSSFEIRGTLHLFPGNPPEFATHHTGTLFLPVTNQQVRRQGRIVSGPDSDVVFVNRHSIVQIRQLDTLH